MNPRIASFLRYRTSRLHERLIKYEQQSRKQRFEKKGKHPWSLGYDEYKWEFISSVIDDPSRRAIFSRGEPLPQAYGIGLDERVIEYPWVIAQLEHLSGSLLDAGSTLNYEPTLHHQAVKNKKITIVNLNPEKNCFWKDSISYVFGDICALPFQDCLFDVITCISTLEHIGMDNEIYTGAETTKQTTDYREAIKELKRVLKPGGALLVTVPFGQYQDFGFFQQFDEAMIKDILGTFDGSAANVSYYHYTPHGWVSAQADACAHLTYFNVHETKYFDPTSKKNFDNDGAAAARAVACIQLIK